MDKMIDPFRTVIADHIPYLPGHISLRQNTAPYGIVHIMVDISDLIGKPHYLPFQRGRISSGLMV